MNDPQTIEMTSTAKSGNVVPMAQPAPVAIMEQPRAIVTPLDMLDRALAQGATPEVLAKFMDLHDRWERGQARKAFDAAIASAKAKLPVIAKTQRVDYQSTRAERNGRVQYAYEDFATIAKAVDPILGEFGLSYRFRPEVGNGFVKVTCILSHRDGHSEESTLVGPLDNSGNKNPMQQMGSTVTYLQRYTLKAALGIAASEDDDGRASGGADTGEIISKAQADEIREKIDAVGIPLESFLGYMKVPSIDDIPARLLNKAMHAIGASKAAKAQQRQPVKPAEDMTDMPDIPDHLRRGRR